MRTGTMFLGGLERVDGNCVVGWIANTNGIFDQINVRIAINDTKVIEVPANIIRPDLDAATGSSGRGFHVDLAGALQPGFNTIRVEPVGIDFTFPDATHEVFATPTDGAFGRTLRMNQHLFLFDSLLKRTIESGIPLRCETGKRRMAQVLSETRLVFVLFSNRSGSNVITDMLKNMGIGGGVTHEPFLADVMKEQIEKHSYTSIEHYLAEIIDAYRQNGTAFLKIGWDALFFLSATGVLDGAFRNCCCIWARRRDKILQAISYIKALETGIFFEESASQGGPSPRFKAFWQGDATLNQIAQATHDMHVADMRLGYFLEMQGLPSLEVFYEDLNDDMDNFYAKLRDYVESSFGISVDKAPFEAKLRKHESPDSLQIKQLYLNMVRLPGREPAA